MADKENDEILPSNDFQQKHIKKTIPVKGSHEDQLQENSNAIFPVATPTVGQNSDKQQTPKNVSELSGHQTSTNEEDDKKIDQNQINKEQARQAFRERLKKNYKKCHSQLQKILLLLGGNKNDQSKDINEAKKIYRQTVTGKN